jgi:hypothetical protein
VQFVVTDEYAVIDDKYTIVEEEDLRRASGKYKDFKVAVIVLKKNVDHLHSRAYDKNGEPFGICISIFRLILFA